jgi:periplasmic protein CpxP/Spy
MRPSFRQSIFATTAILGMSTFAAIAAPPVTGDAPAAKASSPASPAVRHNREVTVEQRITDLHAKLAITPAQQPKWDAFAQVMRDNARDMNQTFQQRVNTMRAMTAPENMQSYAQVAASHAEAVQRLVPAFQTLYDTMSDTQKKTADQIFRTEAHHGEGAHHS